ncbi:hypothetical protein ABZ829_35880 [Streptomyces xanthochromogenes]|uniref:hypothetical protein n=1 Tax=Streptomyces xanthochromogenes TaxID=67384 RepID=UPI00341E1982
MTVALAAVLSGCGTGSSRPDIPPLGEVSSITSVRQVVRPIDAYLPTASQNQIAERAIHLTTARCLRQFGSSEPPGADPAQPETKTAKRDVRAQLFGYFAPDLVATTGYNAVSAPEPQTLTSASTPQILTGRDKAGNVITEYRGKIVPKGGCLQKGLDAVGGSMFLTVAAVIPAGGPKEPLNDPRIVNANHQWSVCMKSHGFAYATPADAYMDPRWHTQPSGVTSVAHSPTEIATATADTTCKQSTNFMGIAVAVQTAYDKQYIAANKAQLASFTQRLHKHIADAEKIISDGGVV